MRLRDQLPRRISDPLARVRNHVARRAGADDPVRERRKRREQGRQPHLEPGLPSEVVDLVGHSHTATVSIVTNAANMTSGASVEVTATCAGGSQITGGGCETGGTTSSAYVEASWPPSGTTWKCRGHNPGPSDHTVTVYAVCQETPIA